MELCNIIDNNLFLLKKIRNIIIDNEMWFVAKDICDILDTKDVTVAISKLPEKFKKNAVISTCDKGGNQYTRIVNEAGLYMLIMRSKKPVADKFQNVICEYILPSIRRGEFILENYIKSVEDSVPSISLPAPSISFDDDDTILVEDDELSIEIPTPIPEPVIPSDEKEMNFENITKRNVELNPRDFDKFVRDCCDVGEDLFTPKGDLRNAYRIWSNCTMKDVVKDFDTYLNTTFKSGAQFIDNSRRNVFRGVKLNDLQFTSSVQNLDYEKFITERCSVHYDNRISYSDFYSLFEEYKQETNSEYKLTKNRQKEIKKYLTHKFIEGRVYISTQEKSGGLFGVYGLGHISNNFGLKEVVRKTMKVGVYNSMTNELIESFDSTLFASHSLKIPFSTLGNHIRLGKIIDNKIFKFIEDK